MEFNFNYTPFFALQRLDSPVLRLKPEQVASISDVYNGKDIFIWLPTRFGKSVCYETTPFLTETIPFIMDCKLQRVGSESGKYSSSPGLVLVQYVTSSSTWIGNVICPSSSVDCLGIDNYTHPHTVDTRLFFLGWVRPGNEAKLPLTLVF